VISNQRFIKTMSTTAASGSNEMAKLLVDSAGYKYWRFEISSADGVTGGAGGEAGDISVWATGF
jgi:hypothetical protein